MALSKEQIAHLNALSDKGLLIYLSVNYGQYVPKWEKCSKEEYEKGIGNFENKITKETIEKAIKNMCDGIKYKAVPYYKDKPYGILNQISINGCDSDGYTYYKSTESKYMLMLGSDMLEYCQTRECMKPYFKQNKETK